eukprot:11473065-Heterocapsa_arctica.AAC.1
MSCMKHYSAPLWPGPGRRLRCQAVRLREDTGSSEWLGSLLTHDVVCMRDNFGKSSEIVVLDLSPTSAQISRRSVLRG